MKLIVNSHKIELIQEQAVNEKEIDISKCEFEFADEITNDYVKEAYFTLDNETYKQVIVNNECSFPQEVLVRPATIELGVVAYLVDNGTEIKRYNPTPVYFKTDLGSLKTAQNSQPITPSEMEQYEQALQDGLSEVANVDIDASKVGNTATVTITNRNGESKSVQVKDGDKGDKGDTGATGATGATGPAGKDGVDGVSPTATVTKSGSTATITITDKNGTTTTTVSDGVDGANGTNGRDGYVQYTAGDNITIDANNVISAVGGSSYSAGDGIDITNDVISTKGEMGTHILNPNNNYMYHIYHAHFEQTGEPTWYSAQLNPFLINIINDYIKHYNSNASYNMMVVYVHSALGNVDFVSTIQNWNSTPTPTSFSTYDQYFDYYRRYTIRPTYTDGVCTSVTVLVHTNPTTTNEYALRKNNTNSYTPTSDYNPATKKYVDDITGALTNLSTTSKTDLVSAINEVFGMAGVPKLTSSTVSVASLNAGVYILDGVTKITNSGATYNLSEPSILMVVNYSANTKGAFVFTRIGGITYMSHTTTTSISLFNVADKNYVDTAISNKIWIGTQTEYDNLSTYSDSTVYFIKEDANASE